jgi:hypothetical protein
LPSHKRGKGKTSTGVRKNHDDQTKINIIETVLDSYDGESGDIWEPTDDEIKQLDDDIQSNAVNEETIRELEEKLDVIGEDYNDDDDDDGDDNVIVIGSSTFSGSTPSKGEVAEVHRPRHLVNAMVAAATENVV